jgi:DoxX-like family
VKRRHIYLATTAILVLETVVGAFSDLARLPYVGQDVRSIGYPTYVLYIVGVWKVLAVFALLGPRLPRLREWAYAGIFFEMFGAVESHVLAGDHFGKYAVPLAFSFLTLVSWWLQPDRVSPRIRQMAH